ncbi:solute carrier family 24 (sodium/potassium/calcium exchanger), member 6 [Fistulifera solaris]|uniref:Solute carrier family 24 (Sodium/potassium/calcium exchanger), member 6 n=1 Tax=Fistulifera solaris TaxID=1519565 RepID=A0A1Z5KLL7_FISSO|nr:solute carrier family 24 (sodium/potassium/calcium exchanger), member 6 [Fistulifera solaris]|eukprot:GAX27176.1 solute carrier family 24 (sodium/potassium/calcium exchanger), member 6 [Fistulifera solaris]
MEVEESTYRPRKLKKDYAYATKFGLLLTAVTVSLFVLLSLVSSPASMHKNRWLEEDDNNNSNNNNNNDDEDYTAYSCHYLYEKTPEPGEQQCRFARTCNGGDGIWAPFLFCSNHRFSTTFLAWLISPIILLWMVLLFRMLGSSAEDFFSPALEMFSIKLGLPPRFAGVTLLALGNGAADVSATISAIKSDPEKGYELSLGALTGAAMFISGLISAVVVLAAHGVPCRGALVRDVTMLCITVLVVWHQLSQGKVGPETMTIFVSLYLCFVFLVLAADIYHRAVVIPRLAIAARERERRRQLEAQQIHEATVGEQQREDLSSTEVTRTPWAMAITALSNYDNAESSQSGWAVESDDLAEERPVVLHGSHGILRGGDGHDADHSNYSILNVDSACVESGSPGVPAGSWKTSFKDGRKELIDHMYAVWGDIFWNDDVDLLSQFLLLCEFPFTFLRKITIPIPCEGHYVRGLVALSMVLSPVWFMYYLWRSHSFNMFSDLGWLYFLLAWMAMCAAAMCILRYAPNGEGEISLPIATPIALYGFIIAATWIDTIADALVSLLNFLGIILRIPGPIIGLTILAWGNSMGDLSANVTMARKGLGNMAMTACFAGPVFNILIGLGLGFGSLAAITGNPETAVHLSPSIVSGLLFIALNGILILTVGLAFGVQGRIDTSYGFSALALYVAYLVTAISMQYSQYS